MPRIQKLGNAKIKVACTNFLELISEHTSRHRFSLHDHTQFFPAEPVPPSL